MINYWPRHKINQHEFENNKLETLIHVSVLEVKFDFVVKISTFNYNQMISKRKSETRLFPKENPKPHFFMLKLLNEDSVIDACHQKN